MSDEGLVIWLIIIGISVVALLITRNYEKTHAEEIKKKAEAKFNATHTTDGQVKCPSCGSTQVQLVNRRWSVMAGPFTNKVDRVCVNCKKRF